MALNKSGKSNLLLGLFALGLLLVHLAINTYTSHLSILTELIPVHIIIYSLCALVYNISKIIAKKHTSSSLLVVLGSITAKMFMALSIIIVFYLLKENNTKPFVFSFLIAYIIYLPVISFIFIKDFK